MQTVPRKIPATPIFIPKIIETIILTTLPKIAIFLSCLNSPETSKYCHNGTPQISRNKLRIAIETIVVPITNSLPNQIVIKTLLTANKTVDTIQENPKYKNVKRFNTTIHLSGDSDTDKFPILAVMLFVN